VTRVRIAGLLALAAMFAGEARAADADGAKFIGCWETVKASKCGQSTSKICFGTQGKAINAGYVACEQERFEEKYSYKIAVGLLTLKSDIRPVSGGCKATIGAAGLELSCEDALKDFDGKYAKRCSKLNGDGSDCSIGGKEPASSTDKIN
jgi:hypothetical protein